MSRIEILGTAVDDFSQAETLDRAVECIEAEGPHLLCTVNLRHIMLARKNPEFADLTRRAEIVVPDGVSLVWAARWAGVPLRERVTGSDLVPVLCRMAAEHGYRVFFLGAAPGVADDLAERMKSEYPGLEVVGAYSPPMNFEADPQSNQQTIERVRQANPHILITAFGAPRQEVWLDRHRDELGVPLMIGVGAAFDFLTGRQKRAPVWMQDAGLEWLQRLVTRPVEMSKRAWAHWPLFGLLLLDQLTYRLQRGAFVRVKPLVLGLTDALVAAAAWFGAYFLYFRSGLFSVLRDPSPDRSLWNVPGYADLLPFVVLLTLIGLASSRLYSRTPTQSPLVLLKRILRGVVTAVALLIIYAFTDKDVFVRHGLKGFSRGMFLVFGSCEVAGLFISRSLMAWVGRVLSQLGIDVDRILLVGSPSDDDSLHDLLTTRDRGWRVLGYVDDLERPADTASTTQIRELEHLGGIEDLRGILHGRKVDEVLVLHSDPSDSRLWELARTCAAAGVRLSLLPRGFELLAYSAEVRHRGPLRLITIDPRRLREQS